MQKTMIRATVDMDFDLKDQIHALAQEKRWSFAYTCYFLLNSAIKERNRKKKPHSESIINK